MKDSFILYTRYTKNLKRLSMEQRGRLFTAILAHESGEDVPELDPATAVAFDFICADLDENRQKYEERCRINSVNGKSGGRPRKQTEPNETEKTERFSEKPKKADNEYDNDNEYISKDIYIEIRKRIIAYLNEKAGTNYRHNTKDTIKHIDARLKDGYTEQDFYKVIDRKCSEWLGTEMSQYLRPYTLFAGKFEAYLNAPDAKAEKRQDNAKQIRSIHSRLSEIEAKVGELRKEYESTQDRKERFEIHNRIANLQDEADRLKKVERQLKGVA